MTKGEAYKTLKENLCAMCAYSSQNMESCDIRSCDNRDAIKVLEQEKPETVTEFADRCQECGAKYGKLLKTVNRAHWIDNHNGTISCSHCSTWFYKDGRYAYMRHCPYCNVKMAEREVEE